MIRKLCVVSLLMMASLVPGRAFAATLTIAWDPDPGAVGYMVSYGTQSGTYTTTVNTGAATLWQVNGLADGTAYYFIVRAYDATNTMSAASSEVAGQTPVLGAPPVITCPAPSTTSSNGLPVPVVYSPTVTGGTAPVTTSCSPASGSLFPVGTTALTCQATDAMHLTSSCGGAVVVVSLLPTLGIACPVIAPVVAKNTTSVKVNFNNPTVTGGVAPVNASCTPASGSQFPVGTTTVTCTATDAAQQTAMCATQATVTTAGGSTTTPTPTPTPTTGSLVEFDGIISALAGRCPAISFNASTYVVTANSTTSYDRGSCSSGANGKPVHVKGMTQSDGTVLATSISYR